MELTTSSFFSFHILEELMADEEMNSTYSHQDFIFQGFPGISQSRLILILPFLSMYMTTVVANGVMIITILVEKTLHSPMYILICLLFFTNISYTHTIMPKFLIGLIFDANQISLTGCLVQMFFMYLAGCYESHLLVLMGLDRYIAIIMPLHYHRIMTRRTVACLLFYGLLRSLVLVFLIVYFASTVQFCRSSIIRNFVCENMSLLNLGCGDISKVQSVGLWVRMLVTAMDGTCILTSYLSILCSVRNTIVGRGREKAWKTCSTHLIVTMMTFFCGTSSSMVYRMSPHIPIDAQNLISLMSFEIPSNAHPIIYGLQTREIRNSLRKLCNKTKHGAWT
ncbi:olfactory receptor 52D1-like [Anomaloglossus baeobatrachus]|uniref:olfactory receptor 52D1-like n=1 Tax=Anomaloglossus baeobatrachus TaxID=238106 RepID=UPI003F4F77E0